MRSLMLICVLLLAVLQASRLEEDAQGCCVGSDPKCAKQNKKAKCKKAKKNGVSLGCTWSTDPDECTFFTVEPVPGCCYGAHAHCDTDDAAKCAKRASKYDCEWRSGEDADCSADVSECGFCFGEHAHCDIDDAAKCIKRSSKYDCEWREADCPPSTTAAPICSSTHRHRKSWQESSDSERQLYIDGFKELASQGITQQFTQTHLDSSEHNNAEFLPWHREYIYRMENAIRDLGGKFSCFTLPYWDWSREPTPTEVRNGATLYITNSGLGGDSNGQCLDDDVWGYGAYEPLSGSCLVRDLEYPDEVLCAFTQSTVMMDLIDWSSEYGTFRPYLEGSPHALPHLCIGGDANAHMATYNSPDDPIFYLHHTYVDFIWALWQDCNDYDGATHTSWSEKYDSNVNYQLRYSPIDGVLGFSGPRVSETFDILADYDVSYSKGQFWIDAGVDDAGNCNAGINSGWFYDEAGTSVEAYDEGDDSSIVAQCNALTGTTHEIGVQCCLLVQEESGTVCTRPSADDLSGALDPTIDATTGKPFERDPETGDIVISLELITDELGAYRLPSCVAEFRAKMYPWAKMMNQLEDLQNGCYDPYCDAHPEGCFNGDKHSENRRSVFAVLVESAVTENANQLLVASAVMMTVIVMAVKGCGDKDKKLSAIAPTYGSTV